MNWAMKQRGLKPAAKVVLLCLADRHNPLHGCFPSQSRIAEDSEMSERAVRDQLKVLIAKELISRSEGRKKGGVFESTRYTLGFEMPGHQRQNLPLAKASDGKANRRQEMTLPAAISAGHRRQNLPPNPVSESRKEPSKAEPARNSPDSRVLDMQARLIEAMDLTGREMTTSGAFFVKGLDVHNLAAGLAIWDRHGLSDDQIIAVVRAKVASETEKNASFKPGSIKYFDGPVAGYAIRMAGASGTKAAATQELRFESPEAKAEHMKLVGELDGLRGSNSDAAFVRRGEISAQLQALQKPTGTK